MTRYNDGFQAYGSGEQQGDTIVILSNRRRRQLNRRNRRTHHGCGPAGLLVGAVVGLAVLGGKLCSKAIDKKKPNVEGSEADNEEDSEKPLKKSHDFEESPPAYSKDPKEL